MFKENLTQIMAFLTYDTMFLKLKTTQKLEGCFSET